MASKRKKRRRRAARRRLRNRLVMPAARALIALVSLLSLRAASRLGAAIGRLVFAFAPGIRRRALGNLEIAFGTTLPAARRRRIALESLQRLGANALEWAVHGRHGPEVAARAVVEAEGVDHLLEAWRRGRGVVIVTAHFGLFELQSVYAFTGLALPGKVVGRRPSDASFEEFVVERRRRMDVETIPQTGTREMLRVLRDGGLLGLLPDQDLDKLSGLFLPFFGRDAWTTTGPAGLAIAARAPMVPVFLHRLGPGRHRMVVYEPLEDPGGDRESRIRTLTERANAVIEREIAASPAHWAWIHDRWATTPEELARRRARRAERQARRTRRRMRAERGGDEEE